MIEDNGVEVEKIVFMYGYIDYIGGVVELVKVLFVFVEGLYEVDKLLIDWVVD